MLCVGLTVLVVCGILGFIAVWTWVVLLVMLTVMFLGWIDELLFLHGIGTLFEYVVEAVFG